MYTQLTFQVIHRAIISRLGALVLFTFASLLNPVIARAGDPANGWCLKTDMNYDRQRTATDATLFVTALLDKTGDVNLTCAGDCDQDGDLDGADIRLFVYYHLSPDSDGDGIPNVMETNDGNFAGPTATGTNPLVADTDGDAVSDGNEVFPTVAGLDLHDLGGSPIRKNIYIEHDWFDDADGGAHSHRPTAQALTLIANSFANAPVTNPYGLPNGITLIQDRGQGGFFTGGNLIPGGDTVVIFDSEFNTYKAANFAANRNGFFHYTIHCHRYNSATNDSSGVAELPGDDLIVSL